MTNPTLTRRTFVDSSARHSEILALLVDFYEDAGSLAALDPMTREELEAAFAAVLTVIQNRMPVYHYPPRPGDPPLPVRKY